MSQTTSREMEKMSAGLDRGRGSRWRTLWTQASAALERWHQRRRLLALDDRMLRDIGISRCDAEREAAKRWR